MIIFDEWEMPAYVDTSCNRTKTIMGNTMLEISNRDFVNSVLNVRRDPEYIRLRNIFNEHFNEYSRVYKMYKSFNTLYTYKFIHGMLPEEAYKEYQIRCFAMYVSQGCLRKKDEISYFFPEQVYRHIVNSFKFNNIKEVFNINSNKIFIQEDKDEERRF